MGRARQQALASVSGLAAVVAAEAVDAANIAAIRSDLSRSNSINAILSSRVVSGQSDFFSVSGLTLTLEADATDPFEYDIAGVTYQLVADVTLAVTDNAHNFIYINAAGAMSRSATPPIFSYTAPVGPASGDYWYDLGKHLMKTYNGSAWVASAVIFIGYVRADSAVIDARYVCEPAGLTPRRRWAELGTGADGFLDVSAGTTTIDGLKQYTAIVVRGTGTLTHTAAAALALNVRSQGPVVAIGTGAINLVGKGKAAVAGSTTTPSASAASGFGATGGSGGGGSNAGGNSGAHTQSSSVSQQGGKTGGGAGAAGSAGEASSAVLPAGWDGFLHNIHGGAGGGGGGDGAAAGGNSGAGGGGMNLTASAIAVGATATFSASGADGVAGAAANRGGGGGGGGGILNLRAGNYFETTAIVAAGGAAGGSGGAGSGAGGAGGAGQVFRARL